MQTSTNFSSCLCYYFFTVKSVVNSCYEVYCFLCKKALRRDDMCMSSNVSGLKTQTQADKVILQ